MWKSPVNKKHELEMTFGIIGNPTYRDESINLLMIEKECERYIYTYIYIMMKKGYIKVNF